MSNSRHFSTANKVLLLQNSSTGAECWVCEWDLRITVRKSLIFIQVLCRIKNYLDIIKQWQVLLSRSWNCLLDSSRTWKSLLYFITSSFIYWRQNHLTFPLFSTASLIWFCTALLLEDVEYSGKSSLDHIPYPTMYLHSFPNFKLWTPAIPHHKGTFTTTKYYFKAILTVIGGNWVLSTNTNCGISELDFSWYFNEVCANSTKSSVTPAAEFHIQTFDRVTMC